MLIAGLRRRAGGGRPVRQWLVGRKAVRLVAVAPLGRLEIVVWPERGGAEGTRR